MVLLADDRFKIEDTFYVDLQFKTAQRSGTLVTISNAGFSGVTLELVDGQVKTVF